MSASEAIDTFIGGIGGWTASQLEACARCGICAEACSFYQATGEPELTPVWKIELLRRAYGQKLTLTGRLSTALGLRRKVEDEDLSEWSRIVYEGCALCGRCAMACPMGIQIGTLIREVRKGLAAAGAVPDDFKAIVQKQIDKGSPLGVTEKVFEDRLGWIADEWNVSIPIDEEGVDTLAVFSSIEIMKFPKNIADIARILDAAGESWTVSRKGREGINWAIYEGNAEHTRLFLNRVLDAAKDLRVKRVMVTECGNAYDALRWTAPNLVEVPAGLEITHILAMVTEYVRTGRIRLREGAADAGGVITFHDSCRVARRGGLIEEPRQILRVIAPRSFREMSPNKEAATCCGGGGGVIGIKAADEYRYAVFGLKLDQIRAVGAETVATACATCRLQFLDGAAHFNSDLKVRGLLEMVAEALV